MSLSVVGSVVFVAIAVAALKGLVGAVALPLVVVVVAAAVEAAVAVGTFAVAAVEGYLVT